MTVMYYGPMAGVYGTFHIIRYRSIRVMHCGLKLPTVRRIGYGYTTEKPTYQHLCQRCEKYQAKRA